MADSNKYLRSRVRLNEYLDRSGIATNLQNALLLVLENKPEDPIYFLSEFFQHACTENVEINTAYRNLMFVHHSRPTFLRHVKKIFLQLSGNDSSTGTSIAGKVYNDFLNLITRNLESSIQNQFLSHLRVDDESSAIFDVFYWGVRDSLLFLDFYAEAMVMYETLDVDDKGEVKIELCNRLLSRLETANRLIIKNSKSLIESATLLSIGAVTEVLNEAYNEVASHQKTDTITIQEFLRRACELFINGNLNARSHVHS